MSCDEAREALPLVLAGARDEARRGPLEEHLAGCPSCRREATEIERVLALVRDAAPPRDAPEPPAFEGVLARVRSPARRLPGLAVRAAALLLAAAAGALGDRALSGRASPVEPRPSRDLAREAREDVRRELAADPGGLGASLAALGFRSRGGERWR